MTRTKTSANIIGPMLRLVLAAGAALSPLAMPILKGRLKRGKEDPDRWREKLGEATLPRPQGPLVWLHGVGVGEVMALRGLIASLSVARPDLNFLVTSSARSSADVFAGNLPPRTRHQYLPLDFPRPVKTFLDHWQPDLTVWSDQEVWPRLAVTCARRSIPQALVAARITPASGRAKARFGKAYGDLYRLLATRHAQDKRTAQQLQTLMADDTQVIVSGSLKAAAEPLSCNPADLEAMNDRLKGRRIWCLASSHPGDETIAVKAHEALCETVPDALLIIVPRDPSRADQIAQTLADAGHDVPRRSAGAFPDPSQRYYLADTIGELGLWYRLADTALIGGTFSAIEGHNPWEPAALSCAILHGPQTANFAQDFKALSDANAARLTRTADDVFAALSDPQSLQMALNATAVRGEASDKLDVITSDLLGLLAD